MQDRAVSWETAPAVIGDADDTGTIRLFRAAMEDALDSGGIRVEPLADGGNRLVTAPHAGFTHKAPLDCTSVEGIRTPRYLRG